MEKQNVDLNLAIKTDEELPSILKLGDYTKFQFIVENTNVFQKYYGEDCNLFIEITDRIRLEDKASDTLKTPRENIVTLNHSREQQNQQF